MPNESGFNFGEQSQAADQDLAKTAERLNNPEGQLKDGRKPIDSAQVTDSVTAKFRADAGLTSFESGKTNFRDFRDSIRSTTGIGTVENRTTRFQTPNGEVRGWEHSGKDSTGKDHRMFTTNDGQKYRIERTENGETNLRSESTGESTRALRAQHEVKAINRSAAEVGPARVHRVGEPVEVRTQNQNDRQDGRPLRGETGPVGGEQRGPSGKNAEARIGEAGEHVALRTQGANEPGGKSQAGFEALAKQLGLDSANPKQTTKSLQELAGKLQSLKTVDGQTADLKMSEILKGLDPTTAKTLENYLTQGKGMTTDLRLSQLDQGRLTALKSVFEGQSSKPLGLDSMNAKQTDLSQLAKMFQTRPVNLDAPTNNAFAQNLRDLGMLLKPGKTVSTDSSGTANLIDLISRNIDGNTGKFGTYGNDLIAKMGGPQEQIFKTLIDNSGKLANLIESGKILDIRGIESSGLKFDGSNSMIADLIARIPHSMRGENFVVRGDILGSIAAMEAGQSIVRSNLAGQFADSINTTTRPDGSQVMVSPLEILSGKPIDPVSGLPYDPYTGKLLDPTTGRIVGQVRPGEPATKFGSGDSEKSESTRRDLENKNRDLELEEELRNKRKALLLLTEARKTREQREQQIKEKELREQKQKEEDKKRTKYIVKDGDTLESIAQKQLRNLRLAALIYDINKSVIALKSVAGQSVPTLRKGQIIWLPSPLEQREFRGKLLSGKVKPGTINTTASSTEKYATADEELAAKYGENWSKQDTTNDTTNDSTDDVTRQLMDKAIKQSEERKKNIESVLGSIDGKKPDRSKPSQYVVRLGDSLKLVAMKHPLVRDISLWKLIAEVNKLSTATDAKGNPRAVLTRGSTIKIPSKDEIASYREQLGLTKAYASPASRFEENIELILCEKCGRMSAMKSTLCLCGHKLNRSKTVPPSTSGREEPGPVDPPVQSPEVEPDLKNAGSSETVSGPSAEPHSQIPDMHPSNVDSNKSNSANQNEFEVLEELDTMTRLIRKPESSKGPLTYALEIQTSEGFKKLISYEISGSKTLRHDHYSGPTRKSVKIELPSKAAEELARNDLVGNWKNYKRKFLRA